jgi:hypothetical protein
MENINKTNKKKETITMKRSRQQLIDDVKSVFLGFLVIVIYFLIATIVLSGCGLGPLKIKIDDDVPGNHVQIENETIQGVEFYCQYHTIKDCDNFQSGLTVHIKTSVSDIYHADGTSTPAAGWYMFPEQIIEILWLKGIVTNGLFHELMHHHYWAHNRDDYKHDTEEEMKYFLDIECDIKRAWQEERVSLPL